ncbi:MAG: hypothetical protein AAF441_21495 [Pseudomonadota bacterium]
MQHHRRSGIQLLLAAVLVLSPFHLADAEEKSAKNIEETPAEASEADLSKLRELFEELAPSPAKDTLLRIPDLGRRLLALRSYSRAGRSLRKRWSWTAAQIKAYQGSPEQQALLEEVAAIAAHFAEANPGYELFMITKVRSLDVQTKNWNHNRSVKRGGDQILADWTEKFTGEGKFAGDWTKKQFWRWLNTYRVKTRARLAAPGLSRHGQARAIDFQIKKDGEIIAGTKFSDVAKVWRAEEWDKKLKASIEEAGPSFRGPLMLPPEPWHYDYEPKPPKEAVKPASG